MDKRVSASDANRRFSQLLKGVRAGRSYVVTAHGKPVAKIVPVNEDGIASDGAFKALLARLRSHPVKNVGRWTRDELYDE